MKNETDSGRTLVEMLGVLAMAGVLSVMGVMGYRLAIDKNKANTLVNQAQQRAVIVMEQMTLNRPLSLQEFSSLNKTPAGTFGQATTQGLTKQFGIQVFGVEKRVCENILNMIGEKTPLRRLSHEASPTVAITQCGLSNDFLMVYNQEMKGAPEDTLYCTDDTDCSSENECMGCEEESKSCQNKCQNLAYLESTGTQYIDTGFPVEQTGKVETVIQIPQRRLAGDYKLFGTIGSDNVGICLSIFQGKYRETSLATSTLKTSIQITRGESRPIAFISYGDENYKGSYWMGRKADIDIFPIFAGTDTQPGAQTVI